ncbi:hypothetical protein KQX54_011837 [Cotesia glomerata]|uniref:Uncharacterized protein n=1 Tax=Cotesia glomerata TaxID=32391 RepID=A0AAV7I6Z9_COTGL|nr:hypothetical protein KQX54_011837 [Cotesia glomerata]
MAEVQHEEDNERHVNDEERSFGGYLYHVNKRQDIAIYYVCARQYTNQCNACGVFRNEIFSLSEKNDTHNHPQDDHLEDVEAFKKELNSAARKQLRSIPAIYRYHDVAVNVSYSKMLSSMRTSRKKRVFPDFHSYSEFRDLLYSEDWQQLRWHDGTSTVEVTVHNSGEENESLVFIDNGNMQHLAASESLYITTNSNFAIDTLPAEEMLVVTSILNKNAFLCLVALIKTKDGNCYREKINQLVTILPTPTRIFGNFDAELHGDLETVYPNAEVKGSFYSYCNILFQSATNFGVFQNEDNEIFIRKLMALALLPENKINIVYTAIKNAIPENQKNTYENFLQNFEEKWLRNVGPHRISCFNNMLQLSTVPRATANVLINSKINNKPLWTMLEFIGTIFYKNEINIKSLRDGKRASRKTCLQLDYLISKNVMDRIMNNLKGRQPNYAVFLASASFQLKDSFQTFRHNYEKRVIQSDNLLPLIGDNPPDDNVNMINLTA